MTSPNDNELIEGWRAGDLDAANTFVERHFMIVYRFFATKVASEADDLTQQAFADFQRAVERKTAFDNPRAYVMVCARNRLYMHLRRKQVANKAFDPHALSAHAVDPGMTPSGVLAKQGDFDLLLRALRTIPIASQIVLELYYWEEMPVAQIAEVIEVQPGTVMSRLYRAREKLNAALQQLALDPDAAKATVEGLQTWAARIRAEVGPR